MRNFEIEHTPQSPQERAHTPANGDALQRGLMLEDQDRYNKTGSFQPASSEHYQQSPSGIGTYERTSQQPQSDDTRIYDEMYQHYLLNQQKHDDSKQNLSDMSWLQELEDRNYNFDYTQGEKLALGQPYNAQDSHSLTAQHLYYDQANPSRHNQDTAPDRPSSPLMTATEAVEFRTHNPDARLIQNPQGWVHHVNRPIDGRARQDADFSRTHGIKGTDYISTVIRGDRKSTSGGWRLPEGVKPLAPKTTRINNTTLAQFPKG